MSQPNRKHEKSENKSPSLETYKNVNSLEDLRAKLLHKDTCLEELEKKIRHQESRYKNLEATC